MRQGLWCALVGSLVLSAGMAAPASAATLLVDDDRAQCATAAHTSITSAVAAARAGDELRVCPGLYPEAVRLPEEKPGLRLVSQRRHEAVIRTGREQLISVEASGSDAVISGFTFRPGAACGEPFSTAFGVYAPGSARIVGNRFVALASDCDRGYLPVYLGSTIDGDNRAATVDGNHFAAGGGRGDGSRPPTRGDALAIAYGYGFVTRNAFVGRGIVMGDSGARIEGNTITGARFGIRAANSTLQSIRNNRFTSNEVGLELGVGVDISTLDPFALDPRTVVGNVFKRNGEAVVNRMDNTEVRFEGNGYVENASLAPLALQVDGVVRRIDGGAALRVLVEASCPAGAEYFLHVELERDQPTIMSASTVLQTDEVTCRGNRRVPYSVEIPADFGPGPLSLLSARLVGARGERGLEVVRTGVVR